MGLFSRRKMPRLVGGPFGGSRMTTLFGPVVAKTPYLCRRRATGLGWEHYINEGDGRFVYGGPCIEFDHVNGPPGEPGKPDGAGCCCGEDGCSGRGPWPHPRQPAD